MKTWLTKWRISHALDERRALPPAVERAVESSPELHRFAANASAVDRALKNARPAVAAPAGLHASIMRAVRAAQTDDARGWENSSVSLNSDGGTPRAARRACSQREQTHQVRNLKDFWPRLIPATALAALILLSVWGTHFVRPPAVVSPTPATPAASPLAIAHSALATGGDWIQAVPAAALSPLSEEMIRLNRDLTNAQNYLLASLP